MNLQLRRINLRACISDLQLAEQFCATAKPFRTPANPLCRRANRFYQIAEPLCNPSDSLCTAAEPFRTPAKSICNHPNPPHNPAEPFKTQDLHAFPPASRQNPPLFLLAPK
jgi:hypothetical protein